MPTRRLALLGLCTWTTSAALALERSTVPGTLGAPPAPTPPPPVLAQSDPAPALNDAAIEAEITRLHAALTHEVSRLVTRSPANDQAWIRLARAEVARSGTMLDRPQLLVVVDRNPRVQQLVLMAALPRGEWSVIGGARVSTGSTGRFDHYITPRGVFRVTDGILGYRAQGTLNENGIRGYGAKGMRVWDFGWQVAAKGWNAGPGKPDRTPIRLEMHATDPDRLEQRLGHPASQGCVRIPAAMNRFLDMHGVLDSEYERAAVTDIKFRALLPVGRQPSRLAGNTLVVVDSAETTEAGPSQKSPQG